MALRNQWWLLCALSLGCVARLGSCTGSREADAGQPELFIFNELCALKDNPGPCKAVKERFFFSIDSGRCELFEYGGCGGNANNFETLEACEQTCVVSEEKNPCHLPEAPGPCRGLVTRYFFDSESQQCQHFFYGGCFGNANNFRSMADCRAKCLNPVSERKPSKKPEVPMPSASESVVVQPAIITEEAAVSGSLEQTDNNKDLGTKEPRRSELCLGPVERGPCQGTERRFAFNPVTRKCQAFHYSGCGGNENNFVFRKECIIKCIRKARGKKMIRIRKKNVENIVQRPG